MIKKYFIFFLLFCFTLFGCGNEVDRAIDKLGGTKEEKEEALNILSTTTEDPMPKLIKALNNKRKPTAVRLEVIKLIGNESQKLNDKRAIDSLIKALSDENVEIRLASIEALSQIEDTRYVPHFIKYLDDSDKRIRNAIWDKLEKKSFAKIRESEKIGGFDSESIKKKLKLLEEAVNYNPRNHKVVKELISFYSIIGDKNKALEMSNLTGTFIRDFFVLGPFPLDFSFVSLPDLKSNNYIGEVEGVSLTEFTEVPYSGEVDFRRNPNTKHRNSTFFAFCYLTSPKRMNVLIKITSNDSVCLWLNKIKLMEKESNKMKEEYEHIVKTNLKDGKNELLLKISSKKYPQFSIRISDLNHKPVKKIRFEKSEEVE